MKSTITYLIVSFIAANLGQTILAFLGGLVTFLGLINQWTIMKRNVNQNHKGNWKNYFKSIFKINK